MMKYFNDGMIFRVGIAHNVKQRALNEFAEKLWVLSIYYNRTDALINEAWTAAKFGIPQVRFTSRRSHEDLQLVIRFWDLIEDNSDHGFAALRFFGMDFDKPYWERKKAA